MVKMNVHITEKQFYNKNRYKSLPRKPLESDTFSEVLKNKEKSSRKIIDMLLIWIKLYRTILPKKFKIIQVYRISITTD